MYATSKIVNVLSNVAHSMKIEKNIFNAMSYHAPFHKTIKSLKRPYIISRQQSYGIGCQKWQSAYLIYGCSINRKLSSGVKLTWPNIFIVTLSAEKVIKITQAKMMQNTV